MARLGVLAGWMVVMLLTHLVLLSFLNGAGGESGGLFHYYYAT